MESIETYVQYFRDEILQIKSINSHLYRKILYVTLLDCLSRAVIGSAERNRTRFVRLINEYSGWNDRNRVSTPQLILNLEAKKLINGRLYKEVTRNLGAWQTDRILNTDVDSFVGDLLAFASTEEEPVVQKSSYPELLYIYRNKLVHEFREPGYGIEIRGQSPMPYYHSRHGDNDWSWELVFSSKFFEDLCIKCIAGCERYLTANKIDPYKLYGFGTMWDTK